MSYGATLIIRLLAFCGLNYMISDLSTPPRIFRRVATSVGCQLVTSLVGVGRRLGESRETSQRQLNAEKKKRKDGPRVESLVKILSETHEKITTVEEMMRKLFTGLALTSQSARFKICFAELAMCRNVDIVQA